MTIRTGWAEYLRVSTEDRQTPARSFKLQQDAIERVLIEPSGIPLVAVYRDILTGANYDRAQFQQMLADARQGKFTHLGIYRVDRFGRDTAEGLTVAKELRALGIHLIPAANPGLDISTPDGWMLFTILLGLGEHEVQVLAARSTAGMRVRLESGHWCWGAPDGFRHVREQINNKKAASWMEIDPDRAPIVRAAWDLLLTEEYSLVEICEKLDAAGHTRRNGKRWAWINEHGKRQTAYATLSKIFHNPLYAGWIISARFNLKWGEIASAAGALVTNAEYHRAQEILEHNNRRKRHAKHPYLLQSMLYLRLSPTETFSLQCTTVTAKGRPFAYYFLPKHKLGIDQHGLYLRADQVDAQIPALLAAIHIEPDLIPILRDYAARHIHAAIEQHLDRRLADLKRQVTTLRENEKAYARLWAQGRLTDPAYDSLTAEIHADLLRAQTSLSELQRNTTTRVTGLDTAMHLLSRLPEAWHKMTFHQRRQLLRLLFPALETTLTGQILTPPTLHPPFAYLHQIHTHHKNKTADAKTSAVSTPQPLGTPAPTHLETLHATTIARPHLLTLFASLPLTYLSPLP